MTNWQDEQKEVATGVTDGTIKFRDAFPKEYDAKSLMRMQDRNEVLEEVAQEIENFTFAFGVDTVQSFAAFVRGMKE
jgi:hypothetical protein